MPHLESQNFSLFGSRCIESKVWHHSQLSVGPKANENTLAGDRKWQREGSHVKAEAKVGVMLSHLRNPRRHQKLKEARRDPPLEPWEREREWPCQCLSFRLQPPERWGNEFLLSSTSKFGVISCSSPRKLTQVEQEIEKGHHKSWARWKQSWQSGFSEFQIPLLMSHSYA